MLVVSSGAYSESVRQDAKHIIFVEGSSPACIDVKVLETLFRDTAVSVKPLGPCYSVRSAAQALHPHHPSYYFIIDRDQASAEEVNASWDNFPDHEQRNLLIWRKSELENYFIDPAYASQSKYCTASKAAWEAELVRLANERVFLDATNSVLIGLRDELKAKWVEKFTNLSEFKSKDDAMQVLRKCPELGARPKIVKEKLDLSALEERLELKLSEYSGDSWPLAPNVGLWRDLMSGKPLLNGLSRYVVVHGTDHQKLTGREAIKYFAGDLLDPENVEQPGDFKRLREMIKGML